MRPFAAPCSTNPKAIIASGKAESGFLSAIPQPESKYIALGQEAERFTREPKENAGRN